MELQSCADYISSMRPSGAAAHRYLENLNSAAYRQALNDRLKDFGKVVYSHGQPIWSVPATLASGWLSSPAIRGLKPSTDCGFVNICASAHNAGGVDGNVSLSYAGSSPVHPPGVLFLINDSGQIAAVRQPVVNSPVYEVVVKDGSTLTVLDSLDINKVGSAVNFIALNSHGLIGHNQEWGSGLRAMVVSTSEASRPLPVPDSVAGAPVVSYSMVGLNDDGLALGLLENNQGVAVAVVWEANGAVNLLQDLVPPGSPSLDYPLAIGNGGHILAVDSSTSKVYLLTPA